MQRQKTAAKQEIIPPSAAKMLQMITSSLELQKRKLFPPLACFLSHSSFSFFSSLSSSSPHPSSSSLFCSLSSKPAIMNAHFVVIFLTCSFSRLTHPTLIQMNVSAWAIAPLSPPRGWDLSPALLLSERRHAGADEYTCSMDEEMDWPAASIHHLPLLSFPGVNDAAICNKLTKMSRKKMTARLFKLNPLNLFLFHLTLKQFALKR